MITLSKALRLCDTGDDTIYLRSSESSCSWLDDCLFSIEKLRKKVDMKRIKVIRIEPKFYYDGYAGILFVVRGISKEELRKLQWE